MVRVSNVVYNETSKRPYQYVSFCLKSLKTLCHLIFLCHSLSGEPPASANSAPAASEPPSSAKVHVDQATLENSIKYMTYASWEH